MKVFNIHVCFTMVWLIMLSACMKQQTEHYRPGSMNELTIDASTIKDAYLMNVLDTLRLHANVLQSLGKGTSQLTYQWYYYTSVKSARDTPIVVGNSADLEFVATMETGDYFLVIEATDTQTGLKAFKKTAISVKRLTSEGWLLLTWQNNKANLSIITSANEVYKDFLKASAKYPINSRPKKLFCGNKVTDIQPIVIITDEPEVYFLDHNTFEIHNTSKQAFYPPNPAKFTNFDMDGFGNTSYLWDTQGQMYAAQSDNYPGFDYMAPGTYRSSQVLLRPGFSPYPAFVVIFDEQAKRFLYQDYFQWDMETFPNVYTADALVAAAFDLNNFPDELIYAGWAPDYITDLVSKDANGNYFLNTLDLTDITNKDLYPATGRYMMDIPAGAVVKFLANSGKLPLIYYICNNALYEYRIQEKISIKLYSFPGEEDVVAFKMLQSGISDNGLGPNPAFVNNPATNNRLAIATNNGSGGIFYLFDLTASGGLANDSYFSRTDGFDAIQDIAYKQFK